jgi:hypothetical protein
MRIEKKRRREKEKVIIYNPNDPCDVKGKK